MKCLKPSGIRLDGSQMWKKHFGKLKKDRWTLMMMNEGGVRGRKCCSADFLYQMMKIP